MSDIRALPTHPDDCDVCGGRRVVVVHPVRDRGQETYVSQVGRIRACPLSTGAEQLADLLPRSVLPDGPGGGAA